MLRLFFVPLLLLFNDLQAQEKQLFSVLMDPSLTRNANAVVRSEEMLVEIPSVKEMRIKVDRIVTVLNKNGNGHRRAAIGYNNSLKVKAAQAIMYDAFGNELTKIKRRDFKDISAVDGGTLYSDSRLLYVEYTPVQYPYTMHLSYELSTANTANIPSWYFMDGYLVSMEKSSYKVVYGSPELKPVIKEKNLEGFTVEKKESSNSIYYEARNLSAVKKESLCPPFSQIAPHLMVRMEQFNYEGYQGLIADWEDAGRWMSENLLQGRDELPETTIIKVRNLVKDLTDPLEKAKKIYEYVQQNTRYISVQMGIGGIQPISAIEVDRVKYGDCKGLSNYTLALLKAVGVPAYYTHVEAGRTKVDFEADFADLGQGNHVILAIPYQGDYFWIDCTSQTHPFGFLGDFTDDRSVLIIKSEGGELARTPAYLDEQNYQKTLANYQLDTDGGITGEVSIETRGTQYDNRFHLEEEPPEEIDTYYKNYWDNINNLKLASFDFQNDKEEVRFKEVAAVSAQSYGSVSGDRILFSPNAFNRNSYVPDRHRKRKLPFEISRGFWDEDEFTIHLPEGYTLEALPSEKDLESEFGHYRTNLEYNAKVNTITYRRSLLVLKGVYPKEKYQAYRNFRKQVAGADNTQVVIVRTNPQ